MRAGTYNITIDQGTDWSLVLTLTNSDGTLVNLSGYTARMQIRRDYDSATVVMDLTTQNGRIVLGGAAGTITMSLTAALTSTITRNGVYDIELVSAGGQVSRPLRGDVILRREVTR